MTDNQNHAEIATVNEEQSSPDTERRWPAWMVFFTAWLLPATTARRTQHVTLLKTYLMHLAAIIVATLLCTLFAVTMISFLENVSIWQLYNEFLEEITREFHRHAEEMIAVIGLTILSLEVGFLLVAFLLAPWGAVDEKFRFSFANALRQCWLFTAAIVPYALFGCLLFFLCVLAQRQWYICMESQLTLIPAPSQPPPNATTQQMQEYAEAVAEWHRRSTEKRQEYENTKPWYVKYDEELAGYAGCVGGAWLLWILLRMIGARRRIPPLLRPPTCEYCGYNLTGARLEGRCPECGEPVILSLGSEARPGTPWQHRREIGFLRAWWRSTSEAILHPRSFGQNIQTRSLGSDHRVFLATHLPMVFLIAVTSVLMFEVLDDLTSSRTIRISSELIWLATPLAGYCTAMAVLAIPLLTSWLVAIYLYFEEKRNLMGAAMQMACYLTGFLLLWVLLVFILSGFIPILQKYLLYNVLYEKDRIYRYLNLILFILWLLPNVCGLLLYLWLVLRGTAAARYANK